MASHPSPAQIEAARRALDDPSSSPAAVSAAAWRLFDAHDFPGAARGFARALEGGFASASAVAALHLLAADLGDRAEAARVLRRFLDDDRADSTPEERLDLSAALFDTVSPDGDEADRTDAARRLLDAAAAAGDWRPVFAPDRRPALEAMPADPETALELVELRGYAPPDSGWPATVGPLLEELGRRHAGSPGVARQAERLLHALGDREAAYRVERARREARAPVDQGGAVDREPAEARLAGLRVAVVGGHPALRALVRRDLARAGVIDVREIPSKWEANRGGRAVQATLAGADVAVVIGRHVAHSTQDQVRDAAGRLGIPMLRADSASATAVRRAIETHLLLRATG